MECLKIVFGVLEALGAIGTFGAFLFLFKKDRYKQNQIDKLTNITGELTKIVGTLEKQNSNMVKQIKVSVLPELWTNGVSYREDDVNFEIDISNRGEIAKLLEFKLESNDIKLSNEHLPCYLLKGNSRFIHCNTKGTKTLKDCNYTIQVIYADKIGNKYMVSIEPTKNGIPVIVKNEELDNV